MATGKNTLIILSPGFPLNEADTTCLPAQQSFVQNLSESFPHLHIIVLSFQYPFTQKEYKWNNVDVISFGGRNRGGLKRLHTWYKVRRKLSALHKMYDVLGLLSFWCTECALVGNHFAKKHGLPHFTWILGQDARSANKFVRIIKPKASSLVAMSDFLADEFERSHRIRPQHVIPNGIDPRMYPHTDGERHIDVLGAGSLIVLKQYDIFIEIVAQAKKQFPGIRAVICGNGVQRSPLRLKKEMLQLETTLVFAGECPHPKVLDLMQHAKIFLHPSSYEGFSTVCLEALYAGAHVISFCKPMREVIPHWHVVKDEEEMLAKVLELLSDKYLYHERVLPFSMKDTAKKMMRLFGVV